MKHLYLLATLALLGSAGVSIAAEKQSSNPPQQASAPVQAESSAAMRVFRDPETGELVSQPVTQAQRDALEADTAFDQFESRAVESVATDGSPMIILNGDAEVAMKVARDESGDLHTGCLEASHGHPVTPRKTETPADNGEK